MKGLKTGGRKAGTPNKQTQELQDLANELGVHPFKFMLLIIRGDLRDFGYVFPEDEIHNPEAEAEMDEEDKGQHLTFDKSVGAFLPKHLIPLEMRADYAEKAAHFLYPKRKPAEAPKEDESTVTVSFVSKDEFNKAKGD